MTTTNAIQIVVHSTEEISNNDKSASKVVENVESNEIPTCRICMESQLEDLDPIMPLGCDCGHGLGQAHKTCLIKWFCQQRFLFIFNSNGLPDYKTCEICKQNLSPSVQELINAHWKIYFIQEMAKKNNNVQGNEVLSASEAASEVGLTWKEIVKYIIVLTICMITFVGLNYFVM